MKKPIRPISTRKHPPAAKESARPRETRQPPGASPDIARANHGQASQTNILILTADFGYGHRSTANAIEQALLETHGRECTVEIVNPLDDPRTPSLLRENQEDYDRIVREMPELYNLGFQVSSGALAGSLVKNAWTVMLFNVLRDLVRLKQPDIIVSTYPFFQGILSTIFAIQKKQIPFITVVTDLASVHKLWFHPASELCLVSTPIVYDLALKAGLPAEKVKITGIPVRPDLAKTGQDPAAIRKTLGWRPDLFTVLAIGSRRVENLYESMQVLNHSGLPLQLVVVTGGDEELFRRFQESEWHAEAHVYNFVTEMESFLGAGDCVLSKAGGLIVSESLACGLPMILIDVIPGQETGNAEYVVSGQAGVLAQTPTEVLEAMYHWLEKDRLLYHQQAEQARLLGRPRAAYDAAEFIWSLGVSGLGEG
jgi:1,2-diacylglycerol 3-beta-galactosyltransferase